MERTTDKIRENYSFHVSCQDSVPESIICFLEGKDYEDTVRLAVSLGGDTDTMGAIAGSIAESYYGIPKELKDRADSYMSPMMKKVISLFNEKRK